MSSSKKSRPKKHVATKRKKAVPVTVPTVRRPLDFDAHLAAKPAAKADNHAERVEEHRKQLELIQDVYRQTTQEVYVEPASLAKKKGWIKKNVRELALALGEWHCRALDLLAENQHDALLRMLPDLKAGRWLN